MSIPAAAPAASEATTKARVPDAPTIPCAVEDRPTGLPDAITV